MTRILFFMWFASLYAVGVGWVDEPSRHWMLAFAVLGAIGAAYEATLLVRDIWRARK